MLLGNAVAQPTTRGRRRIRSGWRMSKRLPSENCS